MRTEKVQTQEEERRNRKEEKQRLRSERTSQTHHALLQISHVIMHRFRLHSGIRSDYGVEVNHALRKAQIQLLKGAFSCARKEKLSAQLNIPAYAH